MSALADAALDHLRAVVGEADTPESVAGGKYLLGQELGRGGMGVVYRAHDRELDREVAVKLVAALDGGGDPVGRDPVGRDPVGGDPVGGDLAERLRREARVLARLEHPGIVPVHDVGCLDDGRVFTVMKLVRGRRLDAVLAEPPAARGGRRGAAALAARLRQFLRVCEAVAFAHAQGIVHRDLKPANVMLGPFGEVLVMDWGLAKVLAAPAGDRQPTGGSEAPVAAGATAAGAVLGTPGYMAPEQERGDASAVDARTDVYALGAILRELAAPFRLPAPLSAVIDRAQAASPDDRYTGVGELAADVERFLARQPVLAHREGLSDRLQRWGARHETAIYLVVAYLLLRALFAVWPRL